MNRADSAQCGARSRNTIRKAFDHGADGEVRLHGQQPDIAMASDDKNKKTGEEQEGRANRA